jgi:hypothetical protein
MSAARLALLAAATVGGVVATTRSTSAQSTVKGNPLGEIGVKYQGERIKAHTDTEAERLRLGRQMLDAEARMKAEDPNNSPSARGTRWKDANAERQKANADLSTLDVRRAARLAEIGNREAAELSLLKGKQDQDAVAADRAFINTYAVPAAAVTLSALAMVAGARFGKGFGVKAVEAVRKSVATAAQLGKDSAAISKAGGIITNTPRGDKLRGIVQSAPAAIAKAGETPRALALGNLVSGASAVQGVGSVVGSFYVSDPMVANAMRLEGAAAIGFGVGGFKSLAAARAALPRVSAQTTAQIQAGANRLTREAAGKTSKQLASKAAAGDAAAAGKVVTAQAATSAKRTRAAASRATGSGTVAVAKAAATGKVVTATAQTSTKVAKAAVSNAQGQGNVAVAKARASGRARVAGETADRAAFQARVATKQARLKAAAATPAPAPASPVMISAPRPAVQAAKRPPRQRAEYKDSWQVTRNGVTFTQFRKTPGIRKHS